MEIDTQQVKEDELKEKDDDRRKRGGHESDEDDETVVGEKEDDTKVDKSPDKENPENEKQLDDKEKDQKQQTSQEDGHQDNNNQMENSVQEDGKGGGNQTGNHNIDEQPENEKQNQEPKDDKNQDVPKHEQQGTGKSQEPETEDNKNQDGANEENTKQAKDQSRTPERQTVSNEDKKREDITLLSSGNEGNMETAENIDGNNIGADGNPADGRQDNAVENDSPQMTYRPFSEFEGEHLDKTVQLVNDCFELDKKYESIKLKAVCALAFLVTDADKPELKDKMIAFLLKNLRSALDDTKHEHFGITLLSVQKGVRHLLEMFNKKRLDLLLKHDVLDVLQKGLRGAENEREIEVCIYCLWLLSFNKDCLHKMADKQVMWQKEIRKAIDSTTCKRDQDKADEILEHIKKHLDHERQKKAKKKQKVPDANLGHVMLSYNWGSQPIVTQIRDFLKAEGIDTWMDIPNMTEKKDLLTQRMAEAVEDAAIVIIGVTEKYFNSRNCKYEANYAHQGEKPLLFLKLQKDYRPKGWLGFIQSTEYFFDFTKEGCFDEKSQELLKHIRQILPALSSKGAKENTGTSKKAVRVEHQTPLKAGSDATEAGPSSSEIDNTLTKDKSDKEPQQEQRNKNQSKTSVGETVDEVKDGDADRKVQEKKSEVSSSVNEADNRKSDAGVKNKRKKDKLAQNSNKDQEMLKHGFEQGRDGERARERNGVTNAAESNTEQSEEEKEESETNANEVDEEGKEFSRNKQDKTQNRSKLGDIATEFENKEKKGEPQTEKEEEDENTEDDARLQDGDERETNNENEPTETNNIEKKRSPLASTSQSSSEGESPREENQSRTQRERRRQRSKSKDTDRVCSECNRPYPRDGKERADKPAEKPDVHTKGDKPLAGLHIS